MSALLEMFRAYRAACAPSNVDDERAQDLESSLIDFVEAAWPSIDPSGYRPSWAIDALCEHLQAVTDGEIKRLLVNFPPRCGKTLVTSVCFPAWTWARREHSYLSGPAVRFLCGSYSHTLALMNSNLTRRLILSPWYQSLWGDRFALRIDQNTKIQFDNDAGGSRLATSVSGSLLGIGAALVIVDDPHNVADVESEAERENVLQWWREISTTRLNDPKQAAIVVIMQRLHEEDVSGTILSSELSSEWTHLMIPMRYEWGRHCSTVIGWHDPRGLDDDGQPLVECEDDGAPLARDAEAARILDAREGELMWPERFGEQEVAAIEAGLGPYMASGRLQQSPQPKAGGIFQREWWQVWEPRDGKFPTLDFVIASLDGAFTEDEENDPSAVTVWGVFGLPSFEQAKIDEKTGVMWQATGPNSRRIILIDAWRKHLRFSGPKIERLMLPSIIDGQAWPADYVAPEMHPREIAYRNECFKRRTEKNWGLLEWVVYTCRKWKVNRLLIENKANGHDAAQEIQNRYGDENWTVELWPVKGDKVARALAVQPTFSQLMVYAPVRDWADLVISEMAVFPKGRYDDLTDSATQAISYLRKVGLAPSDAEVQWQINASLRHKPKLKAIYPC